MRVNVRTPAPVSAALEFANPANLILGKKPDGFNDASRDLVEGGVGIFVCDSGAVAKAGAGLVVETGVDFEVGAEADFDVGAEADFDVGAEVGLIDGAEASLIDGAEAG